MELSNLESLEVELSNLESLEVELSNLVSLEVELSNLVKFKNWTSPDNTSCSISQFSSPAH